MSLVRVSEAIRRWSVAGVACVIASVLPSVTVAQPSPWSGGPAAGFGWEVRVGLDIPLENLGRYDLDAGGGIDGLLTYDFSPWFGVYAGLGGHSFDVDRRLLGYRVDLLQSAWRVGLQAQVPPEAGRLGFRLRGGGVYGEVLLADRYYGDTVAESGHGWGWDASAELLIPVGRGWVISPGVRWHRLARDLPLRGGPPLPVDLEYVTVGVGFGRAFCAGC